MKARRTVLIALAFVAPLGPGSLEGGRAWRAPRHSFKLSRDRRPVAYVPFVQFTRGGRLLAVTGAGELAVWDAAGGRLEARRALAEEGIEVAAFDPDGRQLVAATRDGCLASVEPRGWGASRHRRVAGRADRLAVSPGGRRVALAIGDRIAVRRLPDLALETWGGKSGVGRVEALAWSPDGRRLGVAGTKGPWGPGAVEVRRLADWGTIYGAETPERLQALVFHPSGVRLAYGGEAALYLGDLASGQSRLLSLAAPRAPARLGRRRGVAPEAITALAFDREGVRLLVGDESRVWAYGLQDGDVRQRFSALHHHGCRITSISWSPDGRRFVLGCRPGTEAVPRVIAERVLAEARGDAPEEADGPGIDDSTVFVIPPAVRGGGCLDLGGWPGKTQAAVDPVRDGSERCSGLARTLAALRRDYLIHQFEVR